MSRRPRRREAGLSGLALRVLARQGAAQLIDRLLVAFILDVREVPRSLQAQALPACQARFASAVQAFEEVADIDAKRSGDVVEPARRYAVYAPLVLVGLLIGDADHLSQLLLGETKLGSQLSNLQADMPLDFLVVR